MIPIQISNCPITGLERKLTYDFYWLTTSKQIIIRCYIDYYSNNIIVSNKIALKPYTRDLIAAENLVDASNGRILTQEDLEANKELINQIQKHEKWVIDNNNYQQYLLDKQSYEEEYEANRELIEDYYSKLNDHNIYLLYQQYYQDLENYNNLSEEDKINQEEPIRPTEEEIFEDVIVPEIPYIPQGVVWVPNPGEEPFNPTDPPITTIKEYDFYSMVVGNTQIILPNMLKQIILQRDTEGKFNI